MQLIEQVPTSARLLVEQLADAHDLGVQQREQLEHVTVSGRDSLIACSLPPSVAEISGASSLLSAGVEWPELVEVARIELDRVELLDLPDAPMLALAALEALPLDTWPSLRLLASPTLRVRDCSRPSHRCGRCAARDDRSKRPSARTRRRPVTC